MGTFSALSSSSSSVMMIRRLVWIQMMMLWFVLMTATTDVVLLVQAQNDANNNNAGGGQQANNNNAATTTTATTTNDTAPAAAANNNNATATSGGNQTAGAVNVVPQPDPWGGCVLEGQTASSLVYIGQSTIVCLQVANGTDWSSGVSYIRLAFEPQADQYSRLYIPNSFSDLVGNNSRGTIWPGNNITVGAASYSAISFLRTYYYDEEKKVYPFLTAIVDVDHGVVKGITWDNSCVFCPKGYCEEITFNYDGDPQTQQSSGQYTEGCYISRPDCQKDAQTCDLTLYVVWTGTDANKRAFQSSQSRFGAFPPQDIYDEISQLFPTIPTIPSLTGERI